MSLVAKCECGVEALQQSRKCWPIALLQYLSGRYGIQDCSKWPGLAVVFFITITATAPKQHWPLSFWSFFSSSSFSVLLFFMPEFCPLCWAPLCSHRLFIKINNDSQVVIAEKLKAHSVNSASKANCVCHSSKLFQDHSQIYLHLVRMECWLVLLFYEILTL